MCVVQPPSLLFRPVFGGVDVLEMRRKNGVKRFGGEIG